MRDIYDEIDNFELETRASVQFFFRRYPVRVEECHGRHEFNEDELIDAAIAATKNFFEQMGVPTTFKGYGLDGSSIPALVDNVIRHNPNPLGEKGDITADVTRKILLAAA